MMRVEITITDTDTGEQRSYEHDYEQCPILLAIEDPSVGLGLSLTTSYGLWKRNFEGHEYNFLNRHMGES